MKTKVTRDRSNGRATHVSAVAHIGPTSVTFMEEVGVSELEAYAILRAEATLYRRITEASESWRRRAEVRQWPTLADWYPYWFQKRWNGGWQEISRRGHEMQVDLYWNAYLKDALGHIPMDAMQPSDIGHMLHHRYAHLGAPARNRMLLFLTRMFTDAVVYGWCDHQGRIVWKATANPATAVAKLKEQQKLHLTLTDEQAAALLRQMEKNHGTHHAFTICLAFEAALGLRSGEIADLRWSQVTLDDSVYPGAAGAIQWDARQRKAGVVMRVPLPKELVRFLPPRGRPEQRVCGMSPGSVKANMRLAMRLAAQQIGIPHEGLSPHTMRRSFATSLYKDGKAIGQISRALGHMRESTTYTYLQLENRAMNVVELALPRAAKILGGDT